MAAYFEAFVDWDTGETTKCGAFELEQNMDLFRGRCDMAVGHAAGLAECCTLCTSKPGCLGFTLAGTSCYQKTCNSPVRDARASMTGAVSGMMKQRR